MKDKPETCAEAFDDLNEALEELRDAILDLVPMRWYVRFLFWLAEKLDRRLK
jgi:hypothetical protein